MHLFPVNFFGIKDLFTAFDERITFDPVEVAAAVAGMAGGSADLFDFENNTVKIAVHQNFFYQLDIAAFFAFAPQFVAGA